MAALPRNKVVVLCILAAFLLKGGLTMPSWRVPTVDRPWEMTLWQNLLWNMLSLSVTVFHEPEGIDRFTVGALIDRLYPEQFNEKQMYLAPFPAYKCDYIAFMSHDSKRGAESELDRYKRAYILRQRNHCFFSIWDNDLLTIPIPDIIRTKWRKRGSPNDPAILVQRYRAGLLLIALIQTGIIAPQTPGHEPILFYSDGDTMFSNVKKDIGTVYHRVRRASAQKSLEERVCTPPRSISLDNLDKDRRQSGFGEAMAQYAMSRQVFGANLTNQTFDGILSIGGGGGGLDGSSRLCNSEELSKSTTNSTAALGCALDDETPQSDPHRQKDVERRNHRRLDVGSGSDVMQLKRNSQPRSLGAVVPSKRKLKHSEKKHDVEAMWEDQDLYGAINPFRKRLMGDLVDENGKGVWPCARPNGMLPPVSTGSEDELAYSISVSPTCNRGYFTHSGAIVFRASRLTAFVFDVLTVSPWYLINTKRFKMGDQAVWDWLHQEMFGMDWSRLEKLCSYRYRGLTKPSCAYDEAFFKLILSPPANIQRHMQNLKASRVLISEEEMSEWSRNAFAFPSPTTNGTTTALEVETKFPTPAPEVHNKSVKKIYAENGPLSSRRHFGRESIEMNRRKLGLNTSTDLLDEGTALLLEAYATWYKEGYTTGEPHKAALLCSKWFNAASCAKYMYNDPQHSWSCGDFLWHSFGCPKGSWQTNTLSRQVLLPSARCHGVHPLLNESSWFDKPNPITAHQ